MFLKYISKIILFISLFILLGCNSVDLNDTNDKSITDPGRKTVTIIDALGETLLFEQIPKKIATISPTATEMLYMAGGTSILRDRASNFPDEVRDIPDVGSAYNPSIETIIRYSPDLVIVEGITQARLIPPLQQAGLRVMAVKAETIEDIKTNILNLGKVIGKTSIASGEIEKIETRLSRVGKISDATVLLLIADQENNLYAALPESYTGLIASTLGMENKSSGLSESGPYPGFAVVSPESILTANPDVLVTISPAPEPAPRLSAIIARIPAFAGLKSVIDGNVIEADVELFLQAPGPRLIDAVEFLKDRLEIQSR